MKNISVLAVGLAAAFLLCSQGVVAKDMKSFHKSVPCESCHKEKNPTAPTVTQCSGCHGTPEDVAKLTADKYKKYYNPHDSLHYATFADCVACHREHTPSRLDCNNSNCHREFKYKVP